MQSIKVEIVVPMYIIQPIIIVKDSNTFMVVVSYHISAFTTAIYERRIEVMVRLPSCLSTPNMEIYVIY